MITILRFLTLVAVIGVRFCPGGGGELTYPRRPGSYINTAPACPGSTQEVRVNTANNTEGVRPSDGDGRIEVDEHPATDAGAISQMGETVSIAGYKLPASFGDLVDLVHEIAGKIDELDLDLRLARLMAGFCGHFDTNSWVDPETCCTAIASLLYRGNAIAGDYLTRLEGEFHRHGWPVERLRNRLDGRARGLGLRVEQVQELEELIRSLFRWGLLPPNEYRDLVNVVVRLRCDGENLGLDPKQAGAVEETCLRIIQGGHPALVEVNSTLLVALLARGNDLARQYLPKLDVEFRRHHWDLVLAHRGLYILGPVVISDDMVRQIDDHRKELERWPTPELRGYRLGQIADILSQGNEVAMAFALHIRDRLAANPDGAELKRLLDEVWDFHCRWPSDHPLLAVSPRNGLVEEPSARLLHALADLGIAADAPKRMPLSEHGWMRLEFDTFTDLDRFLHIVMGRAEALREEANAWNAQFAEEEHDVDLIWMDDEDSLYWRITRSESGHDGWEPDRTVRAPWRFDLSPEGGLTAEDTYDPASYAIQTSASVEFPVEDYPFVLRVIQEAAAATRDFVDQNSASAHAC